MFSVLAGAVARYTERQAGPSPFTTTIKGLTILRASYGRHPSLILYKPALCMVVQGAKWTAFGDRRFDYHAGEALVVSVETPGVSQITQASPAEPYLGIVIELDLGIMSDVYAGLQASAATTGSSRSGVFVIDCDGPLADCALRALRLLDTPAAIEVLYPAIMREICYWLLTGSHGGEVAKMALSSCHARQRVIQAIHFLRDRFAVQVRVEELTLIAQLSPSAFHRQFKAKTSMTPLQYQKRLRLLEARRLMMSGALNVEAAAFNVGYESPSQFSREYSRMFGMSPRRDIAQLMLEAS